MNKRLYGKHLVRQKDETDCGPACLATVMSMFGIRAPLAQLREISCTDTQGTNLLGMAKGAEHYGFLAKSVKMEADQLRDVPVPSIAHTIIDGILHHYLVILEIRQEAVLVGDPAKGVLLLPIERFIREWTGIVLLLVPSGDPQEVKHKPEGIKRLFLLLIPHKRVVTVIFGISLLYTLLGIAAAFYYQYLLDHILPQHNLPLLHYLSAALLTVFIVQVALQACRAQLLIYIGRMLDQSLMLSFYRHLLGLPAAFFARRKAGEIVSRFIDAAKVREALANAALTIFIDILLIIAGGYILYRQHAFLFFIALSVIPVYILILYVSHRPLEKANRTTMENYAQLQAYVTDSVRGMETLKACHAEHLAEQETKARLLGALQAVSKQGWVSNIQSSAKQMAQLASGAIILWTGAYEVLHGRMHIGQLITFQALLIYFLQPVQNLVNLHPNLTTALVAADRIWDMMDLEQERQPASSDSSPVHRTGTLLRGPIHYRNIDFRYGTNPLILKNINLTIAEKEKIAFVGESGSGKSTLAKLLLHLYNTERGEIQIGGVSLTDIELGRLRSQIGYVPQELSFFHGTVKENLCMGRQYGMESIVEICKGCQIHDVIEQLPGSYETVLEENANNLSAGQKQRLAIARALLKDPQILILDEASSHLDGRLEEEVISFLQRHCGSKTVIHIAHRLHTVLSCDRIVLLEKGEIAETGSHRQLLEADTKYASLWRKQAFYASAGKEVKSNENFVGFIAD